MHITISVYFPHWIHSWKNWFGLEHCSTEEQWGVFCVLWDTLGNGAAIVGVKEQLLSISHLETSKPNIFHLPKEHNGRKATSFLRLLTLVSSLPAKFILLFIRHSKKESREIIAWVKTFNWEGGKREFWFCFKAAYTVLCYISINSVKVKQLFSLFL